MELREFTTRIVVLRSLLLARARQLTADTEAAEDAVQEALLSLWSQRSQLLSHPNVQALALTIVRHKVADQQRRAATAQRATTQLVQPQTAERPDAYDEVERVAHIVGQLPPLQAQIFRLKEIEGYESQEICQILGCSEESLRQNLSRARRHLRDLLTQQLKQK